MKRYALAINLVDDPLKIERYREYHRAVWPEVLACLRAVGIAQMEIYALGRSLFMVLEAGGEFDPERDFGRLLTMSPRYKEWQGIMDTLQERLPEAKDNEQWAALECIFRLS